MCDYDAQVGETVSSALKRKVRELEDENIAYRELHRMVKTSPIDESIDALMRLRRSNDPLTLRDYLNYC